MKNFYSFISGAAIGSLGGLIGLGGAEFRLPLLNIVFKFDLKSAIVINLAISLVTVAFSLIFRAFEVDILSVWTHVFIVLNILMGSLYGSYVGANLVSRVDEAMLKKIVFVFLLFLGIVLMLHSCLESDFKLGFSPPIRFLLSVVCGYFIGLVSSMLGVAGGELIIPAIVLIYGVDIKLAGSLSLLISIPTLLVSLYKYHKKLGLDPIANNKDFALCMAGGSIIGAFLGVLLLGHANGLFIELFLGCLLIVSAFKMLLIKKRSIK
ncbi:MAG TPA: permease [Sulfurovum sp. UBA12169]|nr:MAG TPA: permease [Sulfurovum sp. UBA12169]